MAKYILTVFLLSFFVVTLSAQDTSSVTWILDRIDSVGGYVPTKLTDWPTVIETPYGNAAWFDGINDGLLLPCNPIGSSTYFTVEVFFKPDSNATNNEQRFIHIRNASNDTRRVLLETRLLVIQRWILDTFIKSESSNLTLVDSSRTHTTGEWHHVALTYGSGIMRQYVDGVEIMSGPVTYLPIENNGKTSIGARQDPRSWFKGAIRMVKISKRTLIPSDFYIPTVIDAGSYTCNIPVSTGWNLVSVPLFQQNDSASVIFPGKSGSMYGYNNSAKSYDGASILSSGQGYWANYLTGTSITITGSALASQTITAAQAGWVIVGSRETQTQISSLSMSNGASISGSAFRYDAIAKSYQAITVINPGEAVWVNVTAPCTITIP